MPLITTVLNYFTGRSPSSKDNDQNAKEDVRESTNRSPGLLHKLNRVQVSPGNVNCIQVNDSSIEKNGFSQSKKRTRQHAFDEDDEVIANSQKKRRIHPSSDDAGESTSLQDKVEGDVKLKIRPEDSESRIGEAANIIPEDQEADSLNNIFLNNEKEIGTSTDDLLETKDEEVNSGNNKTNENEAESNSVDTSNTATEETVGLLTKPKSKSVCTEDSTTPKVSECLKEHSARNETTLSSETTKLRKQAKQETCVSMAVDKGKSDSIASSTSSNSKEDREIVDNQLKRDENNNNISSLTNVLSAEEEEKKKEQSLIAQQISEGFLTDSMLDQEKKLHQQHLEEEQEIVSQAMAEWKSTVEQQRYTRLQHLLEKSNVYSSFLLQRIEKQKEENEKRMRKQAKKHQEPDQEESPQTVPVAKRRRRKAKQESSSYNIKDYVDTEALKQSSKAGETASSSADREKCPEFSCGYTKSSETSQDEGLDFKQPKLLTGGSLRDYQMDGVEWLKVLFENGVNGILADEMGLGKTIQCIALLAHLIEMGVKGPFLVTAPLSTLPNWVAEFKRFTPTITVILYHGLPDERARLRKRIPKLQGDENFKAFPVVITSYEIIMRDRRFLDKFIWKYVIVDEGHRIKNLKCRLIRELKSYPSANRLLLTGTPLQNNLSELWSLLNFLLPDIFNDLDSFQAWFDFSAISESDGNEKIIAQEREHHVLERLHAILTPFLLRRLKSDVSIDVPQKKEVIVYAPLTQKQEHWYKLFLDKSRLHDEFKKNKDSAAAPSFSPSGRAKRRCSRKVNYKIFDSDSLDYEEVVALLKEENERHQKEKTQSAASVTCERNIKLANVLMQLRKACNHPYLLEYPLNPETQDYRMDEELVTCCGKMLILDQMLAALKERGHKVLLFSQMVKMLDILQDFCYLRKYKCSRIDGTMKFEDRQTEIDDFNTDPSVLVFLLSTRAGGLGLNLTAADTVILYDSDWNPQQDLQAQDRCHRIGQTKPVVVYRYLTSNTVDQKIVERAAEKRKLEKMVIHKGKFKGVRDSCKLSVKEMMELLQSHDHMDAVNTVGDNTQVLSCEQLNKLLDRSDLMSGKTVASNSNENEENAYFKVVGIVE